MQIVFKRKKLILIGILACAVLAAVILTFLLSKLTRTVFLSSPPEHGTAFVIEADSSQMHGDIKLPGMLKQTLAKRFENLEFGVFMESISASRQRIAVPLCQNDQIEWFRNLITRRGFLQFRLVNENSDTIVQNGEPVPPGYEPFKLTEVKSDGTRLFETLIVKNEAEKGLAGNLIKTVSIGRDNLNEPIIDFALNQESIAAFAEVTRNNIGRRLAIIIDGKLYSAPRITSEIGTGVGTITGNMSLLEINSLIAALNDPLPVPIKILEVNTLGSWPPAFASPPTNWPSYSSELTGLIKVQVRNPNGFKIRVGLRSGSSGRDFFVEPNGVESVSVPKGHCEIFFNYSSEPSEVYQGDSLTLEDSGLQITITKVVNGNYGIRKVK